MMRYATLLIACMVAGARAAAPSPVPPPVLRCEPSARCALLMARDAAFEVYLSAVDAKEREYALRTLTWAGQQDTQTNGAELREQFVLLRKRIESLTTPAERQSLLAQLAQAMAASDLIDEARSLAAVLNDRVHTVVRMEGAVCAARRGRVTQAFALLDEIKEPDKLQLMGGRLVLSALADAGRLDLLREASLHPPGPDINRMAILSARANQVTGNHDAARTVARGIADHATRVAALDQLLSEYRDSGQKSEALATARLLAQEAGVGDGDAWRYIIYALTENGQYAEALKWLPATPQWPGGRILVEFADQLVEPADIRTAEQLVLQQAEPERADTARALLLARVAAGELDASAAVEQVDDRARFAEGLFGVARKQSRRGRRADAQKTLQVAIAATPANQRRLTFWEDVATTQAEIGALADARSTIDRELESSRDRGAVLLRLSSAQARDGFAQDAARTREEGLSQFHVNGAYPFQVESLLVALRNAGMLDEAELQLRRLMDAYPGQVSFHSGPRMVVVERVKRGELPRAMDLASGLSRSVGGDPGPFIAIYCALTGAPEPSKDSWPGGGSIL